MHSPWAFAYRHLLLTRVAPGLRRPSGPLLPPWPAHGLACLCSWHKHTRMPQDALPSASHGSGGVGGGDDAAAAAQAGSAPKTDAPTTTDDDGGGGGDGRDKKLLRTEAAVTAAEGEQGLSKEERRARKKAAAAEAKVGAEIWQRGRGVRPLCMSACVRVFVYLRACKRVWRACVHACVGWFACARVSVWRACLCARVCVCVTCGCV